MIFLALELAQMSIVSILHVNVKMPTVVGILTFISRISFMLSCVEHYWKKFYNLEAKSFFLFFFFFLSKNLQNHIGITTCCLHFNIYE